LTLQVAKINTTLYPHNSIGSCLAQLYQALHATRSRAAALATIMRAPSLRQLPLYRWAAVTVIGTL
jgi:hypothetical protein